VLCAELGPSDHDSLQAASARLAVQYVLSVNHNVLRVGLALILLAGTGAAAPAQTVSAGVTLGPSYSSLLDDEGNSEPRSAVRAGGFVGTALTRVLALRLEAAYAMKGLRQENSTVVALDYVEVPVLAMLALSDRGIAPFVFTGPALGIKVHATVGNLDYGDLVHRYDIGWVFGGGIRTSLAQRRVLIDVRYTRGLRPVFDFGDPEDSDSDDKNQSISLGLGVILF
jgi:hypothetical protein